MSASVEIKALTKRYGAVTAVNGVNLEVRAGEFLTLLGPSGCGKTTLLRLIAGFEAPDAGGIFFGGAEVTRMPAHRRDVNQVFQSYALFPHLNVRENIAFGLKMQRVAKTESARRVAEMMALVALEGCEERMPDQLSGGQRQRVALARALAPQPAVLLLDEPLAALDARLRESMQLELKRLQRSVGTTFVFVTHDQHEALTMSDRIALMNRGRIEQLGDVHELYRRPVSAFAAEFMGMANVFEVELVARVADAVRARASGGWEIELPLNAWPHDATRARVSVRPENVHLAPAATPGSISVAARVEEAVFQGASVRFVLRTDGGTRLVATVPSASGARERLAVGDLVWCSVRAADVVVLK